MRSIFLADAHLKQETDENYRLLLRFLSSLKGNTDTLYIMGDLFEFWIGYPSCPFPRYLPVIHALGELRASGVRIEYFEGNHDFHLGPVFETELRATVHRTPIVKKISSETVYLCHGDQINTRDYGYRLQRAIFHSPVTRLLTYIVPPTAADRLASLLSGMSRSKHNKRKRRWDYRALITTFAHDRFAEGIDTVITGHFHLPFHEKTPAGAILSVGDWITQYSYGEYNAEGFHLRTFTEATGN